MILCVCRWTAAFCECLAWVLPTPSNLRLTPCQNQQDCLLCWPSVWSPNLSWKPPALLSKPTEAVWDYMRGYYPHHPPLHHTGWVVGDSSRTISGQRCYCTQAHHSSCCTSLKSGCWCSVVGLAAQGSSQEKVVNLINGRFARHKLKGACHIPTSDYGQPRGTLEW